MSRKQRDVRTFLQVLIAVLTVIPDVVAKVPASASLLQVVAVATIVTHYFYLVEKLPGFPAWLKVE